VAENLQSHCSVNARTYRVGRLSASDLGALAPHRARTDWALCPDGTAHFWLRVPESDETLFQKIPLTRRWTSLRDHTLIRDGHRVAEATLPQVGWQPLPIYITLDLPQRGSPGMPPPPMALALIKDSNDRPADALICDGVTFATWAETAFSLRLECLHFACCADRRAFVQGCPLPAIPGTACYQEGQLWLPCGYRLPDHLWPELLADVLALGNNRMTLLHPDGSHEKLDSENLIPATRASVRSSISITPAIN